MRLAASRGVPPAQLPLAWLLSKPTVSSPIIGATKPTHLTNALGALLFKLSDGETRSLEEKYEPHLATEAFT